MMASERELVVWREMLSLTISDPALGGVDVKPDGTKYTWRAPSLG
jgi:hypothetical protein